jgi:hypothetical protein
VRIDTGERNGNVRIIGCEAYDFFVGDTLPARKPLINGKNDKAYFS